MRLFCHQIVMMIKQLIFSVAALGSFIVLHAQQGPGKKEIEKLCGCFGVDFKYAETFSPDKNYKYHERDLTSSGIELAIPIENTDKKIVIQHLLIVSDQMIVKHWREDWTFENPTILKFKGDRQWVKESLPSNQVAGKWTQTVWEVSDAPRYQGLSEWISTDGKTFWQNTADAPLPRREYTTRNDYNVLRRGNRIVLNDSGYVHEQDNQKIIRTGKTDKLLVEEKGINSYVRLKDSECQAAKLYWEKNQAYWAKVRSAWDEYLAKHNSVVLQDKIDGKVLHEYLFALAKEYSSNNIAAGEIDSKIREGLLKYIVLDEAVAGK